mmetsp:Transcript_13616/g.42083  ORF Transcript_13616/g.42083 Transcript_13616/m.42083 type:complete len:125 (-) Transcript_13616:706-1080(-)
MDESPTSLKYDRISSQIRSLMQPLIANSLLVSSLSGLLGATCMLRFLSRLTQRSFSNGLTAISAAFAAKYGYEQLPLGCWHCANTDCVSLVLFYSSLLVLCHRLYVRACWLCVCHSTRVALASV